MELLAGLLLKGSSVLDTKSHEGLPVSLEVHGEESEAELEDCETEASSCAILPSILPKLDFFPGDTHVCSVPEWLTCQNGSSRAPQPNCAGRVLDRLLQIHGETIYQSLDVCTALCTFCAEGNLVMYSYEST